MPQAQALVCLRFFEVEFIADWPEAPAELQFSGWGLRCTRKLFEAKLLELQRSSNERPVVVPIICNYSINFY